MTSPETFFDAPEGYYFHLGETAGEARAGNRAYASAIFRSEDCDGGTVHRAAYAETGQWVRETYHSVSGGISRLDGPAIREWHPDGSIALVQYVIEGHTHRGQGQPARTAYSSDGESYVEEWFVGGKRSRIDGPAWIEWADDRVLTSQWWVAGDDVSGQTAASTALLGLPRKDFETEVRSSLYATLLPENRSADYLFEPLLAGVFSMEGIREFLGGAPLEWVLAFESGAAKR